jgi:DnaK suppressor protein
MSDNIAVGKLTPADLQEFEAALLERRRILMGDFRALEEAETRDTSSLSSLSTHLADMGTDSAESDVSLGRRASASSEIQDIDDALDRIRDGTFGLCESCEKPILKARLEAIPYARLCLTCKQEEEG